MNAIVLRIISGAVRPPCSTEYAFMGCGEKKAGAELAGY
jgi:hypothetical protein